jgi:tRNASer (uridine44-2'-O)-methyltransferase
LQKFVFEETGIAAYLVALWRQKEFQPAGGSRRVRFVDLGCGNGFLTHLLVSEGHEGFGLDKVSRKIWDLYPSDTRERLRVEDVDPEQATFPEVDWLIGNHSDELTPWLPEIARRSGPGTRYFVIPCCFWDRQGKYTHKAAGETRYETYLRFVERCGTDNGFKVRSEPLRIPSTKNIAQVGVPHTTRCESIVTK